MAFLAGLLAALLAYLVNRALWPVPGRGSLLGAPLLEEALKTGLALAAGGPILPSHAAFGLAEFLRDAWQPGPGGRNALLPGLAGLAGHLLFGAASAVVYRPGGIAWAVAAGALCHLAWNGLALQLGGRAR